MSYAWSNNHKHGEGMCRGCGFCRALNKSGKLQKHTRWTQYIDMPNHLIPCEGSNKEPINTKKQYIPFEELEHSKL